MQTGIFDRTRLFANILMVILVGMNIFFSVQYTEGIRTENTRASEEAKRTEERIKNAQFMKLFVDSVLGTNGIISFDNRVKLEADIRELNDAQVLEAWDVFVKSETSEDAQKNAVRLMSLITNKML